MSEHFSDHEMLDFLEDKYSYELRRAVERTWEEEFPKSSMGRFMRRSITREMEEALRKGTWGDDE